MAFECDVLTGNVLGHSELDLVLGRAKETGGLIVAHTNRTLTPQLENLITNLNKSPSNMDSIINHTHSMQLG